VSAPYPWQQRAWSMLCTARKGSRPAHAWLLTGRAGIGKRAFARQFAQFALCEQSADTHSPCGSCRSCVLFAAGNHPDLRLLSPLEDATSIAIDQVRELGDFFALTAHYGRAKVALLEPVDRMTRSAANALLKMLEEPPALGLLILVTDHLEQLPATLRSRCQRLALDSIDTTQALEWLATAARGTPEPARRQALALARHAPLAALAAVQAGDLALADKLCTQMAAVASGRVHAVQAAEVFNDVVPAKLADWMLGIAHQTALQRLALPAAEAAEAAGLNSLTNPLNSRQLCEFAVAALDIKRQAVATANFRQGDLIDLLWQAWMRATRVTRRTTPSL